MVRSNCAHPSQPSQARQHGRSLSGSTKPGSSLAPADYTIDIAPYTLDISPKHSIKTIAYNQQVPGPLLRFREGQPVTIDVTNHTAE